MQPAPRTGSHGSLRSLSYIESSYIRMILLINHLVTDIEMDAGAKLEPAPRRLASLNTAVTTQHRTVTHQKIRLSVKKPKELRCKLLQTVARSLTNQMDLSC
jgi:hypothetical protein